MNKSMPHAPPPPGFTINSNNVEYSAPPPPPPYNAAGQPSVVVVVPKFGSESQRLTCPHCHTDISTSLESTAGTKTHLFALLLCVLGLWCCAPCPYCMDSCMVQKHYCPNCKTFLGESE